MGSIVKKITKPIRKLIPKEIKPFVAPIAAYYLGPMALKGLGGSSLTGIKGFLARAAASGATSAATQKLVEDDVSKSSTLLSALSGGLGAGYGGQGAQTADGIRAAKVAGVTPAGETIRAGQLAGMDLEAANALNLTSPGITGQAQNIALEAAAKASGALTPTTGKGIATLVGTAGTASGIEKEMELLDQYNQSLTEQGIEDKSERISLIRKYMANAGFDESQVTDALGRYGYLANGGRVGYQEGGDVSYTDYGRSGVIYMDQDGNPISKEKFLEETDKEEGIPSIRMKKKPKTLKDLLEDPDAVKEMLRQNKKDGGISGYYAPSSKSIDDASVKELVEAELEGRFPEYQGELFSDKIQGIGGIDAVAVEKLIDMGLSDEEISKLTFSPKSVIDYFRDKRTNKKDGGLTSVKSMSRKKLMDALNSMELPEINASDYDNDQIRDILLDQAPDLFKMKEGGIINLKGKEMDLRGGGFVPIGAKERADDVPARLSKNEFVFTADAVRGAGNGDVDKGAQKMYNTMKMLEGKLA